MKDNKPRGQLLFRNTLYTASASMVWQVLAIITLPILISSVGVEDFGIFSLAAASLGYFGIMSMPARQAMIKFAAQNERNDEEINRIFNSAIVLNIGAGILMALILGMLAFTADEIFDITPGNEGRVTLILGMYAIASLIIQPLTIYGSLLLGFQNYGPTSIIEALGAVARVIVITAIWYFDGSIIWYAINELGIEIIRGLILRRIVLARYSYIKINFDNIERDVFGRIFRYGGWTVLYTLSFLVVTQGSRILVGVVLSVAAITYFHIASMLYNLVNTVSNYIRHAILPSSTAAMKDGDAAFLDKLIYSGTKIVLCVLVPVCVQLAVFSATIISIWMGSEFLEYTVILSQLMILSWLFILPTFTLVQIYWGQDDISAMSLVAIVMALIFIPCMVFLLKSYGLSGVGIAIMTFFAIQLPFQLYIISNKIEINLRKYLIKICLPIYAISILYGYIVHEVLSKIDINESLLLLIISFGASVLVGILLNILITSRNEGIFLISKFQQLLSKT